jgi:hypothetical protein
MGEVYLMEQANTTPPGRVVTVFVSLHRQGLTGEFNFELKRIGTVMGAGEGASCASGHNGGGAKEPSVIPADFEACEKRRAEYLASSERQFMVIPAHVGCV